jgi:hypothetical protein
MVNHTRYEHHYTVVIITWLIILGMNTIIVVLITWLIILGMDTIIQWL